MIDLQCKSFLSSISDLADLGTRLLEPDTFEGLCDRIMVNRSIPKCKLEQPSGTGSTAQDTAVVDTATEPHSSQKPDGSEDELSDAPTVSPSDSDSQTVTGKRRLLHRQSASVRQSSLHRLDRETFTATKTIVGGNRKTITATNLYMRIV